MVVTKVTLPDDVGKHVTQIVKPSGPKRIPIENILRYKKIRGGIYTLLFFFCHWTESLQDNMILQRFRLKIFSCEHEKFCATECARVQHYQKMVTFGSPYGPKGPIARPQHPYLQQHAQDVHSD